MPPRRTAPRLLHASLRAHSPALVRPLFPALILALLLGGASSAFSQSRVPPPGWSEGDPLTPAALDGIWWVRIPFRFDLERSSVKETRQEVPWTPRYVTFDSQGIIHQSGLSRGEKRPAVGVWLLTDGRLQLSISSMTLDLDCYMVQNDKILVAGTCTTGAATFAAAGMLLRLREGDAVQMIEE
jgi:hypothetical protein